MSCVTYDLCLTAGMDLTFSLLIEDVENEGETGEVRTPLDLTGSQVLMKLKKVGAASNILEISSDTPGDSVIDIPAPTTGAIDVLVSGIDTDSLEAGGYLHELSRVIGSTTELIFKGKLTIEKGL